jgi:hypothetical protein
MRIFVWVWASAECSQRRYCPQTPQIRGGGPPDDSGHGRQDFMQQDKGGAIWGRLYEYRHEAVNKAFRLVVCF